MNCDHILILSSGHKKNKFSFYYDIFKNIFEEKDLGKTLLLIYDNK